MVDGCAATRSEPKPTGYSEQQNATLLAYAGVQMMHDANNQIPRATDRISSAYTSQAGEGVRFA